MAPREDGLEAVFQLLTVFPQPLRLVGLLSQGQLSLQAGTQSPRVAVNTQGLAADFLNPVRTKSAGADWQALGSPWLPGREICSCASLPTVC